MAKAAVKTLSDKCVIKAHLVTITLPEENVVVHELGRSFHAYVFPTSFWVRGFQNVNSTTFKKPGGLAQSMESTETGEQRSQMTSAINRRTLTICPRTI
jgi:hypothetical protein